MGSRFEGAGSSVGNEADRGWWILIGPGDRAPGMDGPLLRNPAAFDSSTSVRLATSAATNGGHGLSDEVDFIWV